MMFRPRVIPCLLLKGRGLVKTEKFAAPRYLGDPINIINIFNAKEVDELVVLDIEATREGRGPSFEYLEQLASECFMPLGYGGGVRTLGDIAALNRIGIEKVSLNSAAAGDPGLVREATTEFGSSTIVASIDVKKSLLGKYEVYTHGGREGTGRSAVDFAKEMEDAGVGEILLNSIDRDGTMNGYDLTLVKRVAGSVSVPVVACGGAGSLSDMVDVIRTGGASAAGAGSFFVFHGRHRAVLVKYPPEDELLQAFGRPADEGKA